MTKTYMNWSGGKDSALCLHSLLQEREHRIGCLLTSVNAVHNRISMHGVRRSLLEMQAASIGIPLRTIELPEQPGMNEYEEAMMKQVSALKKDGYTQAAFGDIFLEDLKKYREQKLKGLEIGCLFPLWKKSTRQLITDFIQAGFKAILVCVNEKYLDRSFCGRLIDESFVNDLPENVDPCGENGEYHSFVFAGPIFKHEIPFKQGAIVYRQYAAPANPNSADAMDQASTYGFYFCDLLPATSTL